jgi:NH3-dependent NAD+ synthetase
MGYDMLDSYLAGGKVPEKVRRKIEAMRDRCAHKREMPPICRIDTNAEKHQR